MATNVTSKRETTSQGMSFRELANAIVLPLSSLKLTVFLLVMAVIVTWIATLDQTRIDIWELKAKHFGSLLVYVPFQTLLPPAWFPTLQDVPGGFYIPSGIAIIYAMLINLVAAHSLRFRVQATGRRLVGGMLGVAFTVVITWLVIFGGKGTDGFVAQPFSWRSLWTWLQIGLLGLSLASLTACTRFGKGARVEQVLCGMFGLVSLGVLGFTLATGEKAFVGDSAMRILWQLLQSTVAALCGLFACLMLFRRKAGIVLLHLGIAGLLLNEIYVTVTNEEQKMIIVEGQTTSLAVDTRAYEMAVIDRSDPEFDNVVAIPVSKLNSQATVSNENLPFDIECLDFYINSDLVDVRPGEDARATDGLGKSINAVPRPKVNGTEMDTINTPSAYVRLKDKSNGDTIGVYMISLIPYRSGFVEDVELDGKTYQIGLRYKHAYKPYSIKLDDVKRENYIGTQIPQSYSSDVVFNDFDRGVTSTQKIWMNNPLRYGGETFYQASYDASGPKEATTLQVVKNHGWMIPYVCCMFVVVGLVFQFGRTLLSFLRKQQATQHGKDSVLAVNPEQPTGTSLEKGRKVSWTPAVVLLVIFGGYALNEFRKSASSKDTYVPIASETGEAEQDAVPLRLDLFGKIPVTFGGRVQPLDSIARNLARQLSNREEVMYRKDKRSAIRWLADTIYETKGFDENYQFLRIEDMNVQQALSLPKRHRFRYTWSELQESESELIKLLQQASNVAQEDRTPMQKRLNEVYGKMSKVVELKRALTDPAGYTDSGNIMELLSAAAKAKQLDNIPLAVSTDNPEEPWISLPDALSREWLNELAGKYAQTDIDELAAIIVNKELIEPAKADLEREELARVLIDDETTLEQLTTHFSEKSKAEVFKKLLNKEEFDSIPSEIYAEQIIAVRNDLAPKLERGRSILSSEVGGYLRTINGAGNQKIEPLSAPGLVHLKKLEPAYQAGDGETFNAALESYLADLDSSTPTGMSKVGVKLESIYNKFSPFYLSMALYLVAFVIGVMGWAGWTAPLNRAAFSLVVLALVIHSLGIAMRVWISGRPPVTNLYSSFVFVSAAAILFMLVAEKITKLGICNIMATLVGFLSLMWAWTMSISDGDTFTVLQAVLDTQFWLSTHVICISLGYCATIAAGVLGFAFVIAGLFTPIFGDKHIRRLFTNVIYGVVCFGLLFSFFGTVLGGLWADDSWGRFWGWDPKENGALMIVLWNAVVLHARWAGIIRERGLAALVIIGNIITVWSWEAVNQMGVGLHAYGGSEGNRMTIVALFWLTNLVVVAISLVPTKFWSSLKDA